MHFGMGEWQVRILNPDLGDGFGTMYKVYLYRQVKNVLEFLQGDSTVIQVEPNERYDHVKPIAELPAECLQGLMEGLWDQGIRPKARRYEEETSLLREVLETQGRHLEDMRAFAFGERNKPEVTRQERSTERIAAGLRSAIAERSDL